MKSSDVAIRLMDRINKLIGAMGIIVMMALTLLTILDIVMRRFFSMPFSFSYEVTQLMVVVIVFCSIPYSTNKVRHVSIDVLVDQFPPKLRGIFRAVSDLFCTVVLAMICWQSYVKCIYEYDIGTMTGELEIPLYPFYFFVSFGALIAGISMLIRTWFSLRGEA